MNIKDIEEILEVALKNAVKTVKEMNKGKEKKNN
jgi:hypothetical protein